MYLKGPFIPNQQPTDVNYKYTVNFLPVKSLSLSVSLANLGKEY